LSFENSWIRDSLLFFMDQCEEDVDVDAGLVLAAAKSDVDDVKVVAPDFGLFFA